MQARMGRRGQGRALVSLEHGTRHGSRPRRAAASATAGARFVSRLALANLLAIVTSAGAEAADVLTQHNDNARTGVNAAETVLSTANVKPDSFGRLWTLYVDGQVVAQPLYVSQLRIDTSTNPNAPLVRGTFNAVVVATMHNTVYVYDADAENRLPDGRTRPLWADLARPAAPRRQGHRHVEHQRPGVGDHGNTGGRPAEVHGLGGRLACGGGNLQVPAPRAQSQRRCTAAAIGRNRGRAA